MKSTHEFLTEMPVAMNGDWYYQECNFLGSKSLDFIDNWDYIDSFNYIENIELKLFQMKPTSNISEIEFVLGYEGIDLNYSSEPILRFIMVARLSLLRNEKYESKLNIDNILQVCSIAVLEKYRKEGIAKKLYQYLVENNYNLLSDGDQYLGARRLWSRLSNNSDLIVDVVDIDKMQIIKHNVKLHHGKLNDEFDCEYYSQENSQDNNSKFNIRFLLRKVQ